MASIKPKLRIPNADGTPSNEWVDFPLRYVGGTWKLWNGNNNSAIGAADTPTYIEDGEAKPVTAINKNLIPKDITIDEASALTSKNIGNAHIPVYFNGDGKPVVTTGNSLPLTDNAGNKRTIGTANRPVYYNGGDPTPISFLSTSYGGTGQTVNAWNDIKVGYSNEIAISGNETGDIPLVLTANDDDSNGFRQLQVDTDLRWRTTENRLLAPAATITSLSSTSFSSNTGTINNLIVSKIQRQLSDGSLVEFGNRYSLSKDGDTISLTATDGTVTTVIDNHTDTTKLPLTGGTMTGDIEFSSINEGTNSNGIYWSGGTDGAKIYYSVPTSDEGHLVFNITDDDNTRIDFNNSGTTKSYITMSDGKFHGTATTADLAIGVKDAGDGRTIKIQYSADGMLSADWLAAWDGSVLKAISPSALKSTIGAGGKVTSTTATAVTNVGANGTATVLTGVKATSTASVPTSVSVGETTSVPTSLNTDTINTMSGYIDGTTLYLTTGTKTVATGIRDKVNVPTSVSVGSPVTVVTGVGANGTTSVLTGVKATGTTTVVTSVSN